MTRRQDVDGVWYEVPEILQCCKCGDRQPADLERSSYGLPRGWEAWSHSDGYRAGVVCGPCVLRLLDNVLDLLRRAPADFRWSPDDGPLGGAA